MKETKKYCYVYVAGPLTIGDILVNTATGINIASKLFNLKNGIIPFCPHLSSLWHLLHPQTWDEWLEYDEAWILRCDALLRIPGVSKGADREEAFCNDRGIPVFYTAEELITWWQAQQREMPKS